MLNCGVFGDSGVCNNLVCDECHRVRLWLLVIGSPGPRDFFFYSLHFSYLSCCIHSW